MLGDRTGTLEAAPCEIAAGLVRAGRAAAWSRAGGSRVRSVRDAEPGEYDLDDLLDGPRIPVDRMEADLRALIATIQCGHLRALLDRVFGAGTETWEQFREAPAAKRYHQAYRHGLLEHSLDRRAGRVGDQRHVRRRGPRRRGHRRAAARHRQAGRLHGRPAGDRHDRPRQAPGRDPARLLPRAPDRSRTCPGFPSELAVAVLHIILSHHGQLEHGSPVVPCTREATLVHMIDNLGGRLGSFDRLEKELPDGSAWSGWDRVARRRRAGSPVAAAASALRGSRSRTESPTMKR